MPKQLFQPGNTIGHAGRPKGAKNRLATTVFADLLDVWDEPVTPGSDITRGRAALRVMSRTHPDHFAKLYAGLLPREFWVESTANQLDDDELDKVIEALRQRVIEAREERSLDAASQMKLVEYVR
jgi:hypothetical protein